MKTWAEHQMTRSMTDVRNAALDELAALEAEGHDVSALKAYIGAPSLTPGEVLLKMAIAKVGPMPTLR